ncbi:MAG TPA: cupin domain-containing protein, partial [Acidimicrobiia bacterium]|nr:cupin domain-containing protein [Acidimicrobiia bacterium]
MMNTTTDIDLGAIQVRFLVEAEESQGAATVFRCEVAPGAMVPGAHSHDGFEETVYGLEGVMTFTVDGVTREVGPGDAMCIRRGQVHRFVNESGAPAAFLSVATPGIFGPDYFHDIRAVVTAGGP